MPNIGNIEIFKICRRAAYEAFVAGFDMEVYLPSDADALLIAESILQNTVYGNAEIIPVQMYNCPIFLFITMFGRGKFCQFCRVSKTTTL